MNYNIQNEKIIQKVEEEKLSGVAGGFICKGMKQEGFDVPHDEAWKEKVKKAANRVDSLPPGTMRACVCGPCPGCGEMMGTAGDVCEECRKEAGC